MVFMGSDEITLPSLEFLLAQSARLKLEAIYTQPDRPHGRGKKVLPGPVKTWALQHGLTVIQPERIQEAEVEELRALNPDVILVMAYGHLLPKPVLEIPRLGIYNLHTSLLPDLRGPSPIESAVATGRQSGVTLMQLIMKMDAGSICDQKEVPMDLLETGGSYRKKLSLASAELLQMRFSDLIRGSLPLHAQEEDRVTYCRILVKQDGQLDFTQPAESLARRINGLNPWPGCSAIINELRLKIGTATWTNETSGQKPGAVIRTDKQAVHVATGKGVLQLLSLQKPGGKVLPVDAFLRGHSLEVGSTFSSEEMHALVSRKPVSRKRVFQLYRKP